MSINSFPTLSGLAWPVARSPEWSSIPQKAISGKKTVLQLYTYPLYKWDLQFSYLGSSSANTDWQTLVGFFNQQNGSAVPFHFADAVDNSVTTQALGTADGTTTKFNCVRTLGGFVDPIQDATQSGFDLYDNGSLVSGSDYTFLTDSDWGFTYGVQFNSAPTSGHAITATFDYNWPCRFSTDTVNFSQFMTDFWELKKCGLESVKVI